MISKARPVAAALVWCAIALSILVCLSSAGVLAASPAVTSSSSTGVASSSTGISSTGISSTGISSTASSTGVTAPHPTTGCVFANVPVSTSTNSTSTSNSSSSSSSSSSVPVFTGLQRVNFTCASNVADGNYSAEIVPVTTVSTTNVNATATLPNPFPSSANVTIQVQNSTGFLFMPVLTNQTYLLVSLPSSVTSSSSPNVSSSSNSSSSANITSSSAVIFNQTFELQLPNSGNTTIEIGFSGGLLIAQVLNGTNLTSFFTVERQPPIYIVSTTSVHHQAGFVLLPNGQIDSFFLDGQRIFNPSLFNSSTTNVTVVPRSKVTTTPSCVTIPSNTSSQFTNDTCANAQLFLQGICSILGDPDFTEANFAARADQAINEACSFSFTDNIPNCEALLQQAVLAVNEGCNTFFPANSTVNSTVNSTTTVVSKFPSVCNSIAPSVALPSVAQCTTQPTGTFNTTSACCQATQNCPGETSTQCGANCCCCGAGFACCANSSGCCPV